MLEATRCCGAGSRVEGLGRAFRFTAMRFGSLMLAFLF